MSEKTKKYVLYSLMALSALPYLALVKQPIWTDINSILLYLSSVVGYVGISLMVWQLIIGTRSIAGLYFKDLPGLLKTHSWIGKYGTLLIFLHPVFYILSFKESWTYIFTLNFSTSYETAVTYGRLAFYGLLVIWLTSAIVRGMIKYRPWKYIHYLTYLVLGLSLIHVPNTGHSIGEASVKFMWMSAVVISIICVILRLRHFFGYGKLTFKLIDKKQISPDVWQFQLRPNQNSFFIKPGQYIYLQNSLIGEEHPFSVLDFDQKTGQILITFKAFGKFTRKLADAEVGRNLYVDGPYGVFTSESYELPDVPRVFIAGGIGITPFVRHILDPNKPETHLFYANQTPGSASYRPMLKNALNQNYIDIFSKQPDAQPSPNTELGHLNEETLSKYLSSPDEHDYYICGPIGMINSAEQSLLNLGVSPSKIHSEKFEF